MTPSPSPIFVPIDALSPALLGLHPPPLRLAEEAFRQFDHIKRAAIDLGAQSAAVEQHYIDRDYIEDHSVFYAKSLFRYENSCRRIHFFRLPQPELEAELSRLTHLARTGPATYTETCKTFSKENYLGFSVIKPLHGSPVGRTVLKADKMECARRYDSHLLGVELSVFGVPFQQQDVGVSACATTALWTSLRVLSSFESITPATPAQITKLASQSYLPFGRAMPQSEGLNVGQMCQAVEALGVAPLLLSPVNPEDAKGLLYSILKSRIAPVLMIDENELRNGRRQGHAVTATGFEFYPGERDIRLTGSPIADPAQKLHAIFIHDDRIGPYLRAVLDTPLVSSNELLLHIRGGEPSPQTWRLKSILVPIHTKVRMSFSGLRRAGFDLAAKAAEAIASSTSLFPGSGDDPPIVFESWFWRTHKYIEDLLRQTETPISAVRELSSCYPLPRYLGIVRFTAPFLKYPVDVLIDTTSTSANLHIVAILPLGPAGDMPSLVATALAEFVSREREPVTVIAHAE